MDIRKMKLKCDFARIRIVIPIQRTKNIFIGYLPVHHVVCDKFDIGTPNCVCSCASKYMVSPYGVYEFYQDSYNSQVVASA